MHYFKYKDRVILTEKCLRSLSADLQKKLGEVLLVAEICGDEIKVVSPETIAGIKVHFTCLTKAR